MAPLLGREASATALIGDSGYQNQPKNRLFSHNLAPGRASGGEVVTYFSRVCTTPVLGLETLHFGQKEI